MSSVHYKFKSCLQYDTVTFDGLHISLIDLKKAIIQQKKLGKSTEFDLQITNAQSKQRYVFDEDLIPKNASVIVTRVPITEPQRPQPRSWPHYRNDEYRKSPDTQEFAHDRLSQTPDLANADASEDDKIKAMMAQSKFFDPSTFGKGKAQTGTPPVGYVCYKCGKPGHYIYSCSLKGDTNMVDMKIKRSTGIPQSFLTLVDSPDHPGALLTQSGHFAVPTIDAIAYKQGKKERPPFLPDPNPVNTVSAPPAPNELLCPLCGELLTDAVVIPCCGDSFCDECVRNALLDSEEHECPSCHEIDVSPDKLISNNLLRQAVINYLNQTGYTKMKSEMNQMHQQQQQQQQRLQQQQHQLQMQQKPVNAAPTPLPLPLPSVSTSTTTTTSSSAPSSSSQVPLKPLQTQPAPVAAQQQARQQPQPLTQQPTSLVNNVAVVAPTNAPMPLMSQIPMAGLSDARLSQAERPPTPLSDEKGPIPLHRLDEPQKGMAVPVLGSRNRTIRPLHPVRELPRPVVPPRNRLERLLPPGSRSGGPTTHPAHHHHHHPVVPAMQLLTQSITAPSSQPQPPGSYMQTRASMPPGTTQAGYRLPTPGVASGPVMPPPAGFCAPPLSAYSAGPRPYPIRTIPTGPRPLTPEEFYREKRRLIEEDKKKSDPFDDFARELMEFRRDQKRRQVEQTYSLSPSRSRSRSNSRSYSRSLSRSPYRSRSSSRSRSRSRYRSSSRSRGSSRSRSSSRTTPSRRRRYRTRSRTRSRSRSRSYTPRKYSRSRSRSISRSRSRSRSPPYHRSRSPARRRSRTPPSRSRGRTRSPLAGPISSRDSYYRREWSPSYNRGMRSNPIKRYSPPERPFSRYSHFSPQRPEDYYRYDAAAYDEYYREYYARLNGPHGTVANYPTPTAVPVATTTAAPQYDRPYYDPRGRPIPPANASVNMPPSANSPSSRSRKAPMGRSPPGPRRDRPRDKSDSSKPGKLVDPLPAKVKDKKARVKSEDDLRKKMDRKRDDKTDRTSKDKSKEGPRESSSSGAGAAGAKKGTKNEKPAKDSRKKSDSKRHKTVEKSSRNSSSDTVPKEENGAKEPSLAKEPPTENTPNVLKRPLEPSSSVDVSSNKIVRPLHGSDPKTASHSADPKSASRAASAAAVAAAKGKRRSRHQSGGDLTQKVIPPLMDSADKLGPPPKKSRRESAHEKTDKDVENSQHKVVEKVPRGENDMMLPTPELSKWERDDYEINAEPMKPKKKPTERKPLPRSVIESAEKAITEKRRKPSMISTSISTSPKSSLSTSRKVYVDEKDNRKLSSVQITIPGGERNDGSGEKSSRHDSSDKRGSHRDSSRDHPSREHSTKEVGGISSASAGHKGPESSKVAKQSDGKEGGRTSERFERKEPLVDEAKFVPDYEESDSGSDANTSDVEPTPGRARVSKGASDASSGEEGPAKKSSKKSKDGSKKKKKHKKHKKHKTKKSKKKKSHKRHASKDKSVAKTYNNVAAPPAEQSAGAAAPSSSSARDAPNEKNLVNSKDHHEHRDSKVRSRIGRY